MKIYHLFSFFHRILYDKRKSTCRLYIILLFTTVSYVVFDNQCKYLNLWILNPGCTEITNYTYYFNFKFLFKNYIGIIFVDINLTETGEGGEVLTCLNSWLLSFVDMQNRRKCRYHCTFGYKSNLRVRNSKIEYKKKMVNYLLLFGVVIAQFFVRIVFFFYYYFWKQLEPTVVKSKNHLS